ncbi:peptidase U32 family protein [Chitinibacteraceae bacterium HSL-7]
MLAHQIELLAPARTAEIGREAVLHGADAVYIGGPSFGARHNAVNTVSEIAGLVAFAHRYHSRIFTTLNTILHDSELEPARDLIWQLYDAGVDALIVQDMGILELDLPPIELHASTQCDIRSADKAVFLAEAGFSQIVLARELTIPQVRDISSAVGDKAIIEYFIHGALCVAYSGQCYISHADNGRSANRGDCSQACRLPYTLTDQNGGVVAFEKHLLSMKDNDQSANLEALIDAGVRSLKIEGRYKDMGYVKNITAHYRRLLDELMERRPEFAPSSSGHTEIYFTPDVDKTFHRGHTDYFATGRKEDIGAFDSPKYVGVELGWVSKVGRDHFDLEATAPLANGDGLNYLFKREVHGVQANVVERLGTGEHGELWRVFPNEAMTELKGLRPGLAINRNRDHAWEKALTQKSSDRRIDVWLSLAQQGGDLALTLTDADGMRATVALAGPFEAAKDAARAHGQISEALAKLGNTMFIAQQVELTLDTLPFVPMSQLNALRRDAVTALETARSAAWQRPQRKSAPATPPRYPDTSLSYLANVYNEKARAFYTRHGVELIAAAYESHEEPGEVSVMITKHCLRFSYNLCPKQAKGVIGVKGQIRAEPMTLKSGNETYTLKFDCKPCEMHILGKMKPHIFNSAPPTSIPVETIQFYPKR